MFSDSCLALVVIFHPQIHLSFHRFQLYQYIIYFITVISAVYFLIPPYLSNMTAIMIASPINAFENPIQLLAYIDFHSFYFLFPMPYQNIFRHNRRMMIFNIVFIFLPHVLKSTLDIASLSLRIRLIFSPTVIEISS